MKGMKRVFVSISVVALLAVLSVLGVLFFSPSPAEPGVSTPPVAWEPKKLIVTLTPGEWKALQATATIKSDIPETSVEVVPSLIPFVTVQPRTLPPLSAGMEPTIQLYFSVPSETPFQTIEGTLHLRSGSATSSRPLPVTLNIWPLQSIQDSDLEFNYPPSMEVEVFSATPEMQIFLFTQPEGPGFSVEVLRTPSDFSDTIEWADAQIWPFPGLWQDQFVLASVADFGSLEDPVTGSMIVKINEAVYFIENGLGREDRDLLDDATFNSIIGSARTN